LDVERFDKLRGEIIMQEIICEKCVKCGCEKTIYNDSFTSFNTENMKNAVCLCAKCITDIEGNAPVFEIKLKRVLDWVENYDRENQAPQD